MTHAWFLPFFLKDFVQNVVTLKDAPVTLKTLQKMPLKRSRVKRIERVNFSLTFQFSFRKRFTRQNLRREAMLVKCTKGQIVRTIILILIFLSIVSWEFLHDLLNHLSLIN